MSTKKKATPVVKTEKAPFTKKTMTLFDKACKALKLDPKKAMPKVSGMPLKHQKSIMAYSMLIIIIEHINGKWKADYNTGNTKYWTWHWVKADAKHPGGSGFSGADTYCVDTYAGLGSRLCFGSEADEKKYQKPLEELYIAFKLIKD